MTDAAAYESSEDALEKLLLAERVHSVLTNTVNVQREYASQVETKRAHTATCAMMERHNLRVCVAGFSPYMEVARSTRFRGKKLRERLVYKQHVFYIFRIPQGWIKAKCACAQQCAGT